jgi:hypothetical protein
MVVSSVKVEEVWSVELQKLRILALMRWFPRQRVYEWSSCAFYKGKSPMMAAVIQ